MKTGHQATRGEQLLYTPFIEKRSSREVIILHHITDKVRHLQLEIERRCPFNGILFERVIF